MRTKQRIMRAPLAAQAVAGALVLTLPTAAAAAAITTSPDRAPSRPEKPKSHSATHVRRPARRAHFALKDPQVAKPVGQTVTFHGRLLPGRLGRTVRLITRDRNGWQTLAHTRTGSAGGFTFHYRVAPGSRWLRVAAAGRSAIVGKVTGLTYVVASWYYDAGSTACGFHAYYGVANKTLPCGTRVTMSYGGRTVEATVDDRGPFVPGRDFDLNQNVADALGMHAVEPVLASTY